MRISCISCLGVDVNDQFTIYQRVLERKAGIFVVRKVESVELTIVVMPVQLFRSILSPDVEMIRS